MVECRCKGIALLEAAYIADDRAEATGNRSALSKSERRTLELLFAHPIARNLEWQSAVSLLSRLGTVEQLANNETSIRIGAEHQMLRRPHSKDLSVEDIMALRHLLTRSGWSAQHAPSLPALTDFLIAIDHHEARVYHVDLRPADPSEHTIKPYDPHHFLRHLTHKDRTRQQGERAAEDPSFYERIAQAVASSVPHGRIVIVGHGKGHSDAAHHLEEWIHLHHPETFQRITSALAVDLSALTSPQLLALARDTLAPPRT